MPELEDYRGQNPAWCPGCGNFPLLKAFKQAMVGLQLEPYELVVVSGIGQAAKLPHYTHCNTFNGLHGRTLPVATAIRMVNHDMKVIITTGDGDAYGEGGNHFLHALRRNINVKLFVHDNQIYGLTKGQASPTSGQGMVTKAQPFGVLPEPLDPVELAVVMDASFVARGFTGDTDQLKELMMAAVRHEGFALLDILQPCIVFNHLNTLKWYKDRCYHIGEDHDPTDREAAMRLAREFGDRIPTGIIYRSERRTYEDSEPVLAGKEPLVKQPFSLEDAAGELDSYY
jgi:2-oxoglutarate ferredoxin oxidoreductase subunit beta